MNTKKIRDNMSKAIAKMAEMLDNNQLEEMYNWFEDGEGTHEITSPIDWSAAVMPIVREMEKRGLD